MPKDTIARSEHDGIDSERLMASAGSPDQDLDQEQKNAAAAPPVDAADAVVDTAEKKQERSRTKRMKEIIMPQSEVDFVLSYELEPCDPETEAWMKASHPDLHAVFEKEDRRMLAQQEDFKRQIASKGYVAMMVEVADDEEEKDEDEDEDEDEYEEDDDDEDYVLDHETLEKPRNLN